MEAREACGQLTTGPGQLGCGCPPCPQHAGRRPGKGERLASLASGPHPWPAWEGLREGLTHHVGGPGAMGRPPNPLLRTLTFILGGDVLRERGPQSCLPL